MVGPKHFPKRSFKYVYILLLTITLAQLVWQLGDQSPLGFMTLIDGQRNAAIGRAFAWVMFGSFALFVFATYLELEAFEEKERPFENIQKPRYGVFEALEWFIRVALVAVATVKLWQPDSYQEALYFLALVSSLLFLWSVLASLAFQARWAHNDFALLVLALVCPALSWFSSDEQREAEFGLGILLMLFGLTIVVFSLGAYRLLDMASRRPAIQGSANSTG